ncbi:MAG: hypothetical protein ACWGG5_02495 [Stenotrophomonas sp.]
MALLLAILLGVFTLMRRHDEPTPALPPAIRTPPTMVSSGADAAPPRQRR